jgi:hypothetical protein
MPVTVKVNGAANSLVHKGSNGISTATIPDVCKTPSPGGPVPVPYPNISQAATLAKGTTTVKADGGMMIAIKGSEFSLSNGDNAGVAGGVKSSTFMKESTWILYSFDVKMDGQNACRLTDKKFQNHENTADMAGVLQAPVGVTPKPVADDDKCPCCNGPLHDNQKDDAGKPLPKITQDSYYQRKKDAVDQKIAGFDTWAAANPAKATEVITLKFGHPIFPHVSGPRDALAREEAERAKKMLDELTAAQAANPDCPNLHKPKDEGCGTHFDVPSTKRAKPGKPKPKTPAEWARDEFTPGVRNAAIAAARAKFPDKNIPDDDKVNHMTPLDAGGCPISSKNTIPDGALDPPCKRIDDLQTALQGR